VGGGIMCLYLSLNERAVKGEVCLRKNLCKSLHNSKSRSIFAPHLREDAFPKKIGSLGEWLKPAVC
ncbi:hypothetical protein, partial [Phocaeicola plebeius]|uniref:hypothetical protein n=1 Tax=Phocaeicola plebeius TaxID=310297 RepID=UPI0026EDCD2F